MSNQLYFEFSETTKALGIVGCYFVMRGMKNSATNEEFQKLAQAELDEIRSSLTELAIQSDGVLAGFRLLHQKVNCSNRKHVASPENLLGMLLRNGRLPTINLIVDIYNLVSCQTRLALGAHATDKVEGGVELRLTKGDELFVPLGSDKPKPVGRGEYAYVDRSNEIICRLEVRQVEKTKVTLDTTSCFYIVQGNSNTPPMLVRMATERLIELTQRFCGGTVDMLYKCW